MIGVGFWSLGWWRSVSAARTGARTAKRFVTDDGTAELEGRAFTSL